MFVESGVDGGVSLKSYVHDGEEDGRVLFKSYVYGQVDGGYVFHERTTFYLFIYS